MLRTLALSSAAFIPTLALAAPATQQNISTCSARLLAQTTNTYAVAQACAGVQDPKLVVDCVVTLRQKSNLAMPDAGVACAGVKDIASLQSCVEIEKKAGYVDDEAVILCNQK